MDRGAWHAMGHRVTELENWSNLVHTHACMSQYIIHLTNHIDILLGFPGGSDGKASAYNAGDLGSIPGSGRSLGEGNGNPLQHSCLENPRDGEAWLATVHGATKSQTRLSYFTFTFT